MSDMWMTALGAAVVFIFCFAAMAIGLLMRGKVMRGGCGSALAGGDANESGCDACGKRKINLCESDDTMGLADVSAVGTMGRFEKKKAASGQNSS